MFLKFSFLLIFWCYILKRNANKSLIALTLEIIHSSGKIGKLKTKTILSTAT